MSLPEGLISLGKLTFMDCWELQEIRLPKSLKTLGEGTFASCFALTEIELPEGLKTVGEGFLYHCISLTSVVIPASVTEMGDRPFSGDWALKTVEIKGNVPRLSNYSFHECDALQEVLITGSVGTIGDDAFKELDSLERVQIAGGLKTIGKRAFWLCDNLTTVSLPDGVTSIGEEAFKECSSLTTINLPNSITTIGANAFNGTKLTGPLNIPSSLVSLGDNAFHGCSGLTGTLVFPAAMENISTNVFAGCAGIEEIILPRGVLTIGAGAFNNCSGVQRLWLTNSIQSIGANAFNGMKNLKKVYFSGTILEWETGIQWADKGYQIGVAITTNEEIASGSCGEALTWSLNAAGDLTVSGTGDMTDFAATGAPWAEYRDQVKLVIVGQGVTSIGSSAFQDCKNLETVSLPGSLTAHQTKHDLKFTAGAKRPVDGSQQEQPQRLEGVVVRVGSQKVPQAAADTLFPVPDKAVQVVPDGVVAVLVGNDADGRFNLLFAGDAVFLHTAQNILHVGVVQRLAGAGPAHRLYDVDALTQQVQPDGIGKHMVILQNRDTVLDRPLDFTIGVLDQHFFHIGNGSGSTFFVDFFVQ